MPEHISVFVENKPGKIQGITKALADNGISLLGISIASSGDFGVVKLLPDDVSRAYTVLTEKGFTAHRRKVAVVIIDDRPGSLYEVLAILSSNNINVEDCYGFVLSDRGSAAIVLEVEEFDPAEKVLKEHVLRLLTEDEIHTLKG